MRVLNLNLSSCKTQKKIKNPRTGSVSIWRETYPIVYPHIQVWNLHIRKHFITGHVCVALQEFIRYTHMDYSKLNFSCSSFGFVNVLIQYLFSCQNPYISWNQRSAPIWWVLWKSDTINVALEADLWFSKKKKYWAVHLGWVWLGLKIIRKVSDYYDDWNI